MVAFAVNFSSTCLHFMSFSVETRLMTVFCGLEKFHKISSQIATYIPEKKNALESAGRYVARCNHGSTSFNDINQSIK